MLQPITRHTIPQYLDASLTISRSSPNPINRGRGQAREGCQEARQVAAKKEKVAQEGQGFHGKLRRRQGNQGRVGRAGREAGRTAQEV